MLSCSLSLTARPRAAPKQKLLRSRGFSSCPTRFCTRIFSGAVLQPTSPPPPSSCASAQALVLNLRPSRLLGAWWCLLHLLLATAAVLAALPAAIKLLAVLATVGHGVIRRPSAAPRLVLVAEDGFCLVPEWQTGLRPLGARTLVCPFWVRLDLGAGPWPRDILLIVDQVQAEEWRRLRAVLARRRSD